jgi:hypothetical protein
MTDLIVGLGLLAALLAAVAVIAVRRLLAARAARQVGPGSRGAVRKGPRPGQWMQVVARYPALDGRQAGDGWQKPGDGAPTIGVKFTNLSAICPLTGDVMAECECPDCTTLRKKMNRR